VFQFEHMGLDAVDGDKWQLKPWTLSDLKTVMSRWQYELEGEAWGSLYLTNHDQPRALSRFGNDTQYRVESAKMLVTFLHMMQGTPYVYQGEEIGMTNVAFDKIEDYRDVEIHNLWRDRVESGRASKDDIWRAIHVKGRDNARTPMQWNDSQNAGFTTGTPWIQVNPNYRDINVKEAVADPNSIYHYYKKIIQLRKHNPIMVYGRYDLILRDHDEIYAYTRTNGDEVWLVVCNFFANQPEFQLPDGLQGDHATLIVSNYDDVAERSAVTRFALRPYECRVYAL
jgi:oligo-1,6-glucosidase